MPAIRRQATPREHRNVWDHADHLIAPPRDPFAVSLPTHPTPLPVQHQAAREQAALVHLRSLLKPPPPSPEQAYETAVLHGREPPTITRSLYGSRIYDQIVQAARRELASHENLKADPLAELAITSLATAGLGGLAGALGKGAESAAGAAEAASAARAGSSAASLVQALRRAPIALRAAGLRGASERLGSGAAGQALAHPLLTKASLLAAAHEAGIHGGGTEIPAALIAGHARALLENPGKTLPTTARALAGAVAFPAGLGYEALYSAAHGTPAPLANYLRQTAGGLGQMGGHLLSGNPAEVQRSVENEAGLSFLVPIPALSRLERVQRLRSGIRDVAKEARARLAQQYGLPLRHGPGEQHVLGAMERRAQRRDVAKMTSNETLPARLQAARYERPIVQAARKVQGARSLRNLHGPEGGDLIQTLADYGITSPHQLQLLRERGPVSDVPARPGDINLRAVLDFADQNPSILQDRHLWEAVDAYRRSAENLPANLAGNGRRAAALPQGQLFGVRPPEERVPHAAREFTQAQDRAGAWRDLKSAERQAKELRHQARTKLVQANERDIAGAGGAHAKTLREEAKGLYVQARQLETRNRDFRRALNPYSRPGHAVSSRARRRLWDPKLIDEYVQEVNAKAAEHGMVPGTYTHHAPLRQEGTVAPQARFGNAATRVQHVRRADEFALAATDTVDRSLRGLLAGLEKGWIRPAGQSLARRFFSKYSVPIRLADGTVKRRVTQAQHAQAIRDGQISEGHYVWVPEAQYKQAYVDPNVSPERYAAEAHAALRGEVLTEGKGAKGVVVPREAFKEYAAQINPTRSVADRFVNALSKSAGRILLFSPGWIEAQIIAEGLPIVLSNPRLLNPAYIAKLDRRLKEWNDIHPNEAMGFAATMGEAPVRAVTPSEMRPFQSSKAHQFFYDGARAIEHNPIGRALFSTARLRPFVLFDQWRHGKYQKILAAAEVDRRLNGFLSNLQGALIHEKQLSEELRHMSPTEQLHALTQPRFKRDLDKIQGYVQGITGDWTAFTRFERAFAPATVFYGFIRYAFRWPLTFAKEHPVTATINYFLAQQNANQVEKLLHGKPTEFYQYANPVVQDAQGNTSWLPGGARVAPGLSAPAQGLLGGSAPQAAVGSLNPFYGALVGLLTGTTSFGTHDENEGALGLHWSLAAKQLMALPPIARYFGLGESHSPTAEALHKADPNRKLRSLGAPWLPQSGKGALESAEIIRALEREHAGGGSSTNAFSNAFDHVQLGGSSSGNAFDNAIP